MIKGVRFSLILIGIFVCGIAAAVGFWYVSSGDTTAVLAALVEQTPTPDAQPTAAPTQTDDKSAGKQAKQQQRQTQTANAARGAFGVITAVNGTSLTVRDAQGNSRTFDLNSGTQLIVVGTPNATIQNLKLGDKALVLGVSDATTLTPRVVISAPAAYDLSNVVAGRVTSVTGTALVLETSKGTTTNVVLGADSQIFGAQLAAIQATGLKNNAPVLILGRPASADQFNAQVVLTLPNGKELKVERKAAKVANKAQRKAQKQQNKGQGKTFLKGLSAKGAFGTVSSISGTSLTVQPAQTTRDFTLGADTKIIVVGKPNATASDIQQGNKILVLGSLPGQKSNPRAVLVAPADYSVNNVAAGKIMSTGTNQLGLKTRLGALQVTFDNTTQIFGDGLQTMTAADLQTGRGVIVIGVRNGDGTMTAQVVFMPPAKS